MATPQHTQRDASHRSGRRTGQRGALGVSGWGERRPRRVAPASAGVAGSIIERWGRPPKPPNIWGSAPGEWPPLRGRRGREPPDMVERHQEPRRRCEARRGRDFDILIQKYFL